MSAALLLTLGLTSLAGATPLERCRAADADFDYERVIADCSVASAEPGLAAKERTEVFRLLGIAHTALGNEEVALEWFVRVLSIDPGHKLPPEASPVYRKAFDKAKARFDEEGKVSVIHVAATKEDIGDGRFSVSYEVTDRFARVTKAFIVVTVTASGGKGANPTERKFTSRTPLVEGKKLESGARVFTGEVLDPSIAAEPPIVGPYAVEYTLELQNPLDEPVTLTPPLEPNNYALVREAGPDAEEGGGWVVPATAAGGAAAVVMLVIVGGGAVTAGVCLLTPVCRPEEPPQSNVGVARIGVAQ